LQNKINKVAASKVVCDFISFLNNVVSKSISAEREIFTGFRCSHEENNNVFLLFELSISSTTAHFWFFKNRCELSKFALHQQ